MCAAVLLDIAVHAALDIPLEVHEGEGTFISGGLVSRFYLHHDAGICPFGIAGCIGHAVKHYGAVFRGRGNQYAAGAHAEREDSAAIDLLHEGVFGSWHKRLIFTMIAYLVDLPLRMLDPDAKRKAFGLQRPAFPLEKLVNVTCRMPTC